MSVQTLKRWRLTTLIVVPVIGASYLIWDWLGYTRYGETPPWKVSTVVFLVFFVLVFTSLGLSHKIQKNKKTSHRV